MRAMCARMFIVAHIEWRVACTWPLDLLARVMHELSHGTSAKSMTDVRATLRYGLHGDRNASHVTSA
jgi:hypothetical protein